MSAVARVCRCERTTIYNIEAGSTPTWATGDALLRLYQQEFPDAPIPF